MLSLVSVLEISSDGAVRIVTFNRPDELNATDEALHEAVAAVWDELAADRDARAVVVTGRGRAFSAGGDFGLIQAQIEDSALRLKTVAEARRIIHSMVSFPLPVIAAVNGPAVGLGCSLAVLCDLVYMAPTAFLCDPHLQVGLVVGDGGMAWPLHVGLMRAKQALLLGERITAETAVAWGLATRVVEANQLMAEALKTAHRLAALPAAAVQASKRALNLYLQQQLNGPFEAALESELISMSSREHRELIAGLVEKQG